jgi:Domain of unknown function (DU1801)
MAIQTQPTEADVTAFLDAVEDLKRRADGHRVRALMQRVTGVAPVMWGPAIVGFGSAHYEGRSSSGEWPIVAFSPRKAATTIYGVFSDYEPLNPLLNNLGPHTTSKGCLYVKRFDDIDAAVLEQLVRQAWERAN